MKNLYKFVIGFILVTGLVLFIRNGFKTKPIDYAVCYSTATSYIIAEFSETTPTIDFEGNLSTDTDYWSENASEIYTVRTLNGELDYFSCDSLYIKFSDYGYYYPEFPPIIHKWSRDSDFDRYTKKFNIKCWGESNSDKFSIDCKQYGEVVKSFKNNSGNVYMRSWYGMFKSVKLEL